MGPGRIALYALHDALVKPMPGNAWAPSLAESWTGSKDGLTYEFVLRKGVRFHNGDPLSAEDVYRADQDKQFKRLVRAGSGAAGNAATRRRGDADRGLRDLRRDPRLRRLPGHR